MFDRRAALMFVAASAGLWPGFARAAASDVAAFYNRKTIRLVIGNLVGGPYDTYGRLLARHLGAHIPGNPTIVVQNMEGAAGVVATNYIYDVAPQDGTVLGAVDNVLPLLEIVGHANMKFDLTKLNWIGNMTHEVFTLYVRSDSSIHSIEDAKRRQVTLGGSSPSGMNTMFPRVINAVAGTKFHVVTGYSGIAGVENAMQRGEVEGLAGDSWSNGYGSGPSFDWYRDGTVRTLVAIAAKRPKGLSNVPLMTDLAEDPESKQILQLFTSPAELGRPVVMGPNVPPERVAAMRRAFEATMRDRQFLADAKALKLTIDPVPGEELKGLIEKFMHAPDSVVRRARLAVKSQ